MATPALAINIANHKGTLLVSPVWGMVVFSALELAVSLVLGPSVSLVIGFSVSSVFGLFSLGGYGRRRFTLPGRFICCIICYIISNRRLPASKGITLTGRCSTEGRSSLSSLYGISLIFCPVPTIRSGTCNERLPAFSR